MIVTDAELTRRLFEVVDSLTPEEKKEWRDALIAQMEEQ